MRCWQDFVDWFENEYDKHQPSNIPWCNLEQFPTSKFSKQISSLVQNDEIVTWKEPSQKQINKEVKSATCLTLDELKNSVQLTMAGNYSYFGTSAEIADFNGDGKNELVVSAPGYGS